MSSMNFRDALCFWMASHGMTEDECKQVCDDRRMQLCLKMADAGGALSDVRDALYRLNTPGAKTARDALSDPAEKMLFLQNLRGRKSATAKPAASTRPTEAQAAQPVRTPKPYGLSLLLLEDRMNGGELWFALLGTSRKALSEDDVRRLAAVSTVDSACWWMSNNNRMQVGLLSAALPQMLKDMATRLGLRTTDATRTSARSVQEQRGHEDRADGLELTLHLPAGEYLAFIERVAAT